MTDRLTGDDVTPCSSVGAESPWTSEDAEERAAVAPLCQPCPWRRACLDAALDTGVTWGIWAGLDFSDKRQRTRIRREHTERITTHA